MHIDDMFEEDMSNQSPSYDIKFVTLLSAQRLTND